MAVKRPSSLAMRESDCGIDQWSVYDPLHYIELFLLSIDAEPFDSLPSDFNAHDHQNNHI